jgi:AcrR family transcriptional regulator
MSTEKTIPITGSRGGKRRKLILNAFHDCIIKQGYSKTTLRDVAKSAGMSASHLLYYFPGKDAILEHYFEDVSKRIMEKIDSFRDQPLSQQVHLVADLFFAGKGISNSETGFMLECFGVAVHDKELHNEKADLDRFCKSYMEELFTQTGCSKKAARDCAELNYALLIGLRTAAYFDDDLGLDEARRLFHVGTLNLVDFGMKAK